MATNCIDGFFAGEICVHLDKRNTKQVENFCNVLEKLGVELDTQWNDHYTRRQYLFSRLTGPYHFFEPKKPHLLNGSGGPKSRQKVSVAEFISAFTKDCSSKIITEEEFMSALTGE